MKLTHLANAVSVNAAVILAVSEASGGAMLSLDDTRNYFATPAMVARCWPVVGDYLVTQDDGYEYLNPKDVFERKYAKITGYVAGGPNPDYIAPGALIDFSKALRRLKAGDRIARAGWNGKGMWVAMGAAHPGLDAAAFWNPHARAHAEANGGQSPVQAYILMKTAQGDIQMGWSPTQSDALAEDWQIVL